MFGTIIENIVIQAPPGVTPEQIKTIVRQSQEEYKILNLTLGGIDMEFDGNDLIIRSWIRSPYKQVRKIEKFLSPTIDNSEEISIQNTLSPINIPMEKNQSQIDIPENSPQKKDNIFHTLWEKVKL